MSDLSRRAFLKRAAAGSIAAASIALLDSCSRAVPIDARQVPADPAPGAPAGTVTFANWPYYIDRTSAGEHPSLERFTALTGIGVDYERTIRDEASFLGRIRPALKAGVSPGFDLAVLSNGPELFELISNAWLHPIDHALLPNFARFASPAVRNPPWDLGNQYTVAWQSGVTGIAFRAEAEQALGHPPTSIRDLWDPALRGRVGMFRDLNDLGSFGLLALGIEPGASTPSDWAQAADLLLEQRDNVRGYFDQGYVGALRRGHVWATMAWSGDIFQMQLASPGRYRFIIPVEGGMFWTDNLFIPYTAAHPIDAMALMNFVYRARIAAMIAEAVRYTSPVPAAKGVVAHRFGDRVVARNPYVFPPWDAPSDGEADAPESGSVTGLSVAPENLIDYYPFISDEQAREWQRAFARVVPDG